MDFSDPATYVILVTTIVTGASFIVQGLAVFAKITPGTTDDKLVSKTQKFIGKVQRILGTISLDASKQESKNNGGVK